MTIDDVEVNTIFQIDDTGLFIIPNLTSGINRSCRFALDSLSIIDNDADKSFEYSTDFGLTINNAVKIIGETTFESTLSVTGATTLKSTLRATGYIYFLLPANI